MVEAIVMPNTLPSSRNITMLALLVAVTAAVPRYLPTQTALIEPLTDCSTLPIRIGSANVNSVRGIEPLVREEWAGFMHVAPRRTA